MPRSSQLVKKMKQCFTLNELTPEPVWTLGRQLRLFSFFCENKYISKFNQSLGARYDEKFYFIKN